MALSRRECRTRVYRDGKTVVHLPLSSHHGPFCAAKPDVFPDGWLARGSALLRFDACRSPSVIDQNFVQSVIQICVRTRFQQMPKQKTHKGTKKRFRLTAKGKAKHRASGTSHRNSRVSQKRSRNLRGGDATVDSCMEKQVHLALNGRSY